MMNKQMLVKLLLFTILLVTLAEAMDFSKMTPEQKRKMRKALSGGARANSAIQLCTKTGCASGFVCVGGSWGCAVPEGSKCTPVTDRCQGQYYCTSSGICNGSGLKKLNENCTGTSECDRNPYCDLKINKYLAITR